MDTRKVEIPGDVKITVSGFPRKPVKHRLGAVFGPLLSDKRYIIHNLNMTNTLRGIVERVFKVRGPDGALTSPPTPPPGVFKKVLFPEFRAITGNLKLRPFTIKDVVPLWKGSKQAVYRRAYESLVVKPLTREDGFLKTFVKCEKIDSAKGDPAPRVIQPRSPRYNLHLARFIKPHEHTFYERIDKMWDTDGLGDRTIFKGLNASSAAEHMLKKTSRYSNPVFIGLDASRFDQHVSRQALEWEHSIYLEVFQYGHSELARLLDWQIHNVGRAFLPDGKIKYEVEGRRMSGDMNTSLGNCILMSSLVHAYIRYKGIKASLANNGDDCVVITERRHLHLFHDLPTWFLDMGFTMKVEPPVYDLREVSFCQVNVLTSPGYNICVRSPNTCVSKDLHSAFPFTHPNQYRQWLSASGECGRMSHAGIPVLQSFYSAFPNDAITNVGIADELDRWRQYSIVGGAKDIDISDEMRHSFWVAFGITPDCQVALESMFERTTFSDELGEVSGVPYVSYLQGNKN